MSSLVAVDTETHLIAPGAIAPRLVCGSFAMRNTDRCHQCGGEDHIECDSGAPYGDENVETALYATANPELRAFVERMFDDAIAGRIKIVTHNGPFDLAVLVAYWPDLMSKVWLALEKDGIHDTLIREKLLNLATHGRLDFVEVGEIDEEISALNDALRAAGQEEIVQPKARQVRILNNLAALGEKYLGEDRKAEKEGDDIWRLRYGELDGKRAEDYPEAADKYARMDARQTLLVKESQDIRAIREEVPNVFETESFHLGVAFALQLMSCRGFGVDAEMVARIEALVDAELVHDKLDLILKRIDPETKQEIGFLRPGEPPRPYKNGAKNPDGTPKMTAGEPMSVDQTALRAYVVELCKKFNKEVKYTDPSDKFPDGQVCINKEVIGDLAPLDASMLQMQHYNSIQKVRTTEIPPLKLAIMLGCALYYSFDVLKETGRTSSSKFKDEMGIPSRNIQNIASARKVKHKKIKDGVLVDEGEVIIDPRQCYVPRHKGWALCSVDYSALELVSLAQKTYSLFGESVLRDTINAGIDAHTFFASYLAYQLDEDFRKECGHAGFSEQHAIYLFFKSWEVCGDKKKEGFFSNYRKLAKVANLGLPGGLGARTLVTYAKTVFQVVMDEDMAQTLRTYWFDFFPENRAWFEYVNNMLVDTRNSTTERRLYTYTTPLGMTRAGASYCATANGAALQSPAAEGAKLAVFNLVRACYDPGVNPLLYGGEVEPLCFIHDETITALAVNQYTHERAYEISRIMVDSMQVILPDMVVKAEPCLMWRWQKNAKTVFDENGRLKVWEPKK